VTAPLGIGILGAGRIARHGVGPAVAPAGARIAAVGARDRDRAAALVRDLGATGAAAYGSYAEVIEDPAVEAVYIALPNDAHVTWTLEALRAGRHVLVEKPLAAGAGGVERAFAAAAAADRLLVEASWYRWHPRTRAAEELVGSGELGRVVAVDAGFTFGGVGAGDYRLDPTKGGGALYDVGCYALSAALWATGHAPLRVLSVDRRDATGGGVDLETDAVLESGSGARVHVRASIDDEEQQWLVVEGTGGTVRFGPPAFTAWHGDVAEMVVEPLSSVGGEPPRVTTYGPVDPYRLMVAAFASRARGGGDWVVPPEESLAVARAIDAVRALDRPGPAGDRPDL
jgi:xylose dehydrogenase (NAD/NADP)